MADGRWKENNRTLKPRKGSGFTPTKETKIFDRIPQGGTGQQDVQDFGTEGTNDRANGRKSGGEADPATGRGREQPGGHPRQPARAGPRVHLPTRRRGGSLGRSQDRSQRRDAPHRIIARPRRHPRLHVAGSGRPRVGCAATGDHHAPALCRMGPESAVVGSHRAEMAPHPLNLLQFAFDLQGPYSLPTFDRDYILRECRFCSTGWLILPI
jgi:hypothetical protein